MPRTVQGHIAANKTYSNQTNKKACIVVEVYKNANYVRYYRVIRTARESKFCEGLEYVGQGCHFKQTE